MAETYQINNKDRLMTDSTPNGEYPMTVVTQHVNGDRTVMITEPGKSAKKVFHSGSGSHTEYTPEGDVINHTMGESHSYVRGGCTVTIDHNGDCHITGHNKITVGGGAHFEVQGDMGAVVGGSVALALPKGDMGLSVKGNMYLGVGGNMNMNVTGNMATMVGGTNVIGTGAPMTIQAPQLALNPADGQSGYNSTPGAVT